MMMTDCSAGGLDSVSTGSAWGWPRRVVIVVYRDSRDLVACGPVGQAAVDLVLGVVVRCGVQEAGAVDDQAPFPVVGR